MKILKKCFIAIMALIVLAVAGFWCYCRIINQRSFMAGLTDLVLIVQHRSDKFTNIDVADAYIAEKAETNKEPIVIEKAKFGVSIREDRRDAAIKKYSLRKRLAPRPQVFLSAIFILL